MRLPRPARISDSAIPTSVAVSARSCRTTCPSAAARSVDTTRYARSGSGPANRTSAKFAGFRTIGIGCAVPSRSNEQGTRTGELNCLQRGIAGRIALHHGRAPCFSGVERDGPIVDYHDCLWIRTTLDEFVNSFRAPPAIAAGAKRRFAAPCRGKTVSMRTAHDVVYAELRTTQGAADPFSPSWLRAQG